MNSQKRILILDKYQHRLLINILYEKRNNLIREHKFTDIVDEVLLKAVDAPVKKLFKKKEKNRNEAR